MGTYYETGIMIGVELPPESDYDELEKLHKTLKKKCRGTNLRFDIAAPGHPDECEPEDYIIVVGVKAPDTLSEKKIANLFDKARKELGRSSFEYADKDIKMHIYLDVS